MKSFILAVTLVAQGQPAQRLTPIRYDTLHECQVQARAVTGDKQPVKRGVTHVFTSPSGHAIAYCIEV